MLIKAPANKHPYASITIHGTGQRSDAFSPKLNWWDSLVSCAQWLWNDYVINNACNYRYDIIITNPYWSINDYVHPYWFVLILITHWLIMVRISIMVSIMMEFPARGSRRQPMCHPGLETCSTTFTGLYGKSAGKKTLVLTSYRVFLMFPSTAISNFWETYGLGTMQH